MVVKLNGDDLFLMFTDFYVSRPIILFVGNYCFYKRKVSMEYSRTFKKQFYKRASYFVFEICLSLFGTSFHLYRDYLIYFLSHLHSMN